MSLRTGNQAHCDITELKVARRYLKMLEESNIKVTFLMSGKCFVEEWEDAKPISEHPLVEVGGHNFDCFEPTLWHRAWKKINGSYNGPAWYQRRDAEKTAQIIRQRTGKAIQCWRNHMYMHGPHTERILSACGIRICSDGVAKGSDGLLPHSTGIYNFPLNVMPDHEHLYHAERTPETVERWVKRYNWSDDYGPQSYYVEEWTDRVLNELRQHEDAGILSNMIIHPITLYLCDRFRSFQRIREFLSACETVHMSDVIEGALEQAKGDSSKQ